MPTPTYTLIASVTISTPVTYMDFTSIPSTYTDLNLVFSARSSSTAATQSIKVEINNSTTNFTNRELYGDGSTAGSYSASTGAIGYIPAATGTANTFGTTSLYFPNYAGSTNKSFSTDYARENNTNSTDMGFYASLWSDTTAINQLTLKPSAGNFAQYSTAYLYGIVKS
jgi:hypothetical protein